jgi:hypothetical protein
MVLSALAAALLLPGAASAGETPGPVNTERAKLLRARAEALFDQPSHWRKAAKLMEESAGLRAADDHEAYECLISAGRIRAWLKDPGAARRNFERAGDHALARGAVIDAAHAYVFAAHAAKAKQDISAARTLVERARLLSTSPRLTASERGQLLALVS